MKDFNKQQAGQGNKSQQGNNTYQGNAPKGNINQGNTQGQNNYKPHSSQTDYAGKHNEGKTKPEKGYNK